MKTRILILMLTCSLAGSTFAGGYFEECNPKLNGKAAKESLAFVKKHLWNHGLDVFNNKVEWQSEDIGVVFRTSPFKYQNTDGSGDAPHNVRRKYQMKWRKADSFVFITYTTFDDWDDGGNSFGWVEDQFGNVVGVIDDADIYGGPIK